MFVSDDGVPNDGSTQGISRNELLKSNVLNTNGETTEMDGIPEDVCVYHLFVHWVHIIIKS